MTDPTALTNLDLARLLACATLHAGHLEHVPHASVTTYERLERALLVTMGERHEEIPNGCDVHNFTVLAAAITPLGTTVADAMLAAARGYLDAISHP